MVSRALRAVARRWRRHRRRRVRDRERARTFASPVIRRLTSPAVAVGDPAPDFTLATPDGGTRVTLSDHRGRRPVALVFGSYTCPPFRGALDAVDALYERYRERVAFYAVYIREAHPTGGWALPGANRDVRVDDPATDGERAAVAATCAARTRMRLPVLVDGVDDAVAAAYGAWPDRLYLVGRDGTIAYQGGPGPDGFDPGGLAAAIEAELATA